MIKHALETQKPILDMLHQAYKKSHLSHAYMFVGEEGTAQQVLKMYEVLNQLLHPLDREIAQITLSPRLAWQLKLDNEMELSLGREQVQGRVARFVKMYPHSQAQLNQSMQQIDLRYRNGFAVRVAAGRS